MLGKLNMDEFAMGSSNETSAFGPVVNPWRVEGRQRRADARAARRAVRPRRWPADLCLGATATDTGGSIRQPAAFTGTVGIKPTYGRCSPLRHRRLRLVAGPGRADGPDGRGRRHPAEVHGRLRSEGFHQPRRADARIATQSVGKSVKGLRIGVPEGIPASTACRAEIEALWEQGIAWLKAAGCEIVEISLPHTKYALPTYYIVAPAEASSNLARYDGMRFGLRAPRARRPDRPLREAPAPRASAPR